MKATVRAVALAGMALLFAVVVGPSASAQTGTCSDTQLAPGDPITVSGNGAVDGETATLLFEGDTIGATTVDGFGNFSVSGNVPGSTPPGTYAITVSFSTSEPIAPCSVTVQDEPAPPPDDDEDDDDIDDDDEDEDDEDEDENDDGDDQQQQQGPGGQQQQQSGGGGQQQQQQQLIVPASFAAPEHRHAAPSVSSGRSLPKTGMALALEDVTGVSTGSLLVGFSLMEISRRRRRRIPEPVAAAPATAPIPLPRADALSEGDLLWPRWDAADPRD